MILPKSSVLICINSLKITNKMYVRHMSSGISYCAKYSPYPLIVTLTNAYSKTGQYIALLLKQFPVINEIRLFDYSKKINKTAKDLNLIDSSTSVKIYVGEKNLKSAVENAHVIVACPEAENPTLNDIQLFELNAENIRNVGMHVNEFNPTAVLCIAAQPVNSLVPMVSEQYKKWRRYDFRKIIGITTIDVLRANSIVANIFNIDPNYIFCPVIGGSSPDTTVAMLSYVKYYLKNMPNYNKYAFEEVQELLTSSDPIISKIKTEGKDESVLLSRAYGAARFVMQVCKGLKGVCNCVECGFVKQVDYPAEYLSYMSTVIKLGKMGLEKVYMPKVNLWEGQRLSLVVDRIRKDIERGEYYINGETHPSHKKQNLKYREKFSPPLIIAEPTTNMTEVDIDLMPLISKPIQGNVSKNPRYLYP